MQADLTMTQRLRALADLPCPVCGQRGDGDILLEAWEQQQAAMAECPDCSGTGLLLYELTEECGACSGHGYYQCQGGASPYKSFSGCGRCGGFETCAPLEHIPPQSRGSGRSLVPNPAEALITGLLRLDLASEIAPPGKARLGHPQPVGVIWWGEWHYGQTWQEALVQAAEKTLTKAEEKV